MSYVRNNKSYFELFLTLGGSFAGIIAAYKEFLKEDHLRTYLPEATCAVFVLISFLSILTILFGYSRRRDHIITCIKERGNNNVPDIYERICGNGTDKNCLSFLPDYYLAFFIFSLIVLVFFFLASLLSFKCNCELIAIVGALGIISPLVVLNSKYKKYRGQCEKIKYDYKASSLR